MLLLRNSVRVRIFATIILLLINSGFVRAQLVGGTIAGDVVDPSHSAVVGATVLIRNEETGGVRQLVTAEGGAFSAPSIPVGVYSISVTREGFAPLKRTGIGLTVGQSLELHLALTVGTVEQVVTVADTPATVDTSTLQSQGLVDERQVKELPLNGRSFDQLLQLNPASVSYTTQRSGGVGTSNSSVGNMFSISGRRPQDNLFLLNGIEYTGASLINVTPGGTSGQLLGVEAVREFNVVTDTYGANYGKRTGAQISIITASGSNQVHGSVYEFLRNSALDARNYFDQAQIPEFQRNDFGAAFGGPLRRDKLFGFANYEGYRQHLGLSDVTFVPDAAAREAAVDSVKPLLALWPKILEPPELTTTFRKKTCSLASIRWMTAMPQPLLPIHIPQSTNACGSRFSACRSSTFFRRVCSTPFVSAIQGRPFSLTASFPVLCPVGSAMHLWALS